MNEVTPVILAAGEGKRLGVVDVPKPMVSIAERPLMQNAVESLFKIGFSASEIKVVIGYKGEVIKNYFGADLEYFFQRDLNGNAGALESAFPEMRKIPKDRHILTIQGDDADQASPENLQYLIYSHISRLADISILTVSKPDPDSHEIEYIYNNDGRVTDMIPRKSIDSNGRYTAGIYIFSGVFLDRFLPVLRKMTSEGKELGISSLVDIAIKADQRVFQLCSHKEYISINMPRGLRRLREKGING